MWVERVRWWLWGRRRALEKQAADERRAAMIARLHKPPEWIAAYYVDDPAKCYDMRSVAELLGERES